MSDVQPVQMTKRGILHLYPSYESCNADDADGVWIILDGLEAAESRPAFRRHCRRCHTRLEELR